MKEIIIKELRISNFKGQNRVFYPNKDKTFVKGANGIGKTTLYKAFCWLLTSYTDASNGRNHELYDSRLELTPNTPQAIVVAILSIDGVDYKIERRAKAKFTRKRGSDEWVKDSSDGYTLLIDDIEVSATNFNEWIENTICQSEIIPYMLMGERFANLTIDDKKAARKLLEQIADVVSLSDMKGDYSNIVNDLKKYSIEHVSERYKTQLKPLTQRLVALDAIIGEKQTELASFNEPRFKELKQLIDEKNLELSEVNNSIANYESSLEPIASKREELIKEIHSKSVLLGDLRIEYNSERDKALREIERKIKDVDYNNESIRRQNEQNKNEYDYICTTLESELKSLQWLKERREILLDRRSEAKARIFNHSVCAYCGQELPFDDIEREREKFNRQKQEDLDSIIAEGKAVKERIELVTNNVKHLTEKKECGFAVVPLESKDELLEQYDAVKATYLPFENTIECQKLSQEIDDIKKQALELTPKPTNLTEKQKALIKELEELNQQYGQIAMKDSIERNIEALVNEKRNLASEIVRLECCICELNKYEEERANIISDNINNKLKDCKIVMYSRQKDGSLKPDCVIVNNDGVKYATLNNSARIATCLSIQRMFCEHFGVNLPIFVDECSIFDSNHTPKFDAQMIYLLASNDNTLIVE